MKMNSDRNLARCKKEVVENASRIDSTCSCRGDVAVSRRKPCGASGYMSFKSILHFGERQPCQCISSPLTYQIINTYSLRNKEISRCKIRQRS